jgi:hypothetical protein
MRKSYDYFLHQEIQERLVVPIRARVKVHTVVYSTQMASVRFGTRKSMAMGEKWLP